MVRDASADGMRIGDGSDQDGLDTRSEIHESRRGQLPGSHSNLGAGTLRMGQRFAAIREMGRHRSRDSFSVEASSGGEHGSPIGGSAKSLGVWQTWIHESEGCEKGGT
jgi:hypothetical protein